ncbi:unnamed protein product [Bursaphelenchus okinawaensis]|uniref:Alpha-1,3-glucosyltransferase n=1 Tax=Bursaphelenchus okinawaensis TaxID=465554 RepID=A0A811LKA5_9BILA|nr:unnamed protein product [Bursaphelenchus okinawaensis]CAG9125297.1 unnamed protein product [Bursaphelenchus okinawaensis]
MGDILFICGFLVALKLCLLNCYVSTDFEVHRNWLAVTYNLPLVKWYFEDTSEWTIDYPPFFAFFEWILAQFAALYDVDILKIQKEALLTPNVLLFQRISVIFADIVFYYGCYFCAKRVVNSLNVTGKKAQNLVLGLFLVLVLNPGLILLDNVHFQYNSFLYGILLMGIGCFVDGCYFRAGLALSILLNFKHIFLYYVFAFVYGFVAQYLLPINRTVILRIVLLGISVVTPVILSFGPFIYKGGIAQLHQILSRLFPFKRGLTHSYWAPNFWTLYNTVDYILYKLKVKGWRTTETAPQYTNGQVQTYNHSVLPNISVEVTLALVLLSSVTVLVVKRSNGRENILSTMILSAFSFFLFSWHVHEKAVLLIQIPLVILGFVNPIYASISMLFTQASVVALFPLFFDKSIENLIKYGLHFGYIIVLKSVYHNVFNLNSVFDFKNKVFLVATVFLEVYKGIVHTVIFGDRADFLPLMMTSLLCSVVVHYTYLHLVLHFSGVNVFYAKMKLLCLERWYKSNGKKYENDDVKVVGGLDMTQNQDIPSLSTVSYCVLSYPDLKVLHHDHESVVIKYDYLSNYLALRESEAMVNIVNDGKAKVKPDVLLVDGNAGLHIRDFGLGCHVESQTEISTVGVAKKLSASFSRFCDDSEGFVHWLKSRKWTDKEVLKVRNNGREVVVVTKRGANLMFLSARTGTDVNSVLNVVFNVMGKGNCHLIRMSDLCSRHLNQDLFEDVSLRL